MNKQIENLIREQNYEKALCEIEQYEFRNKRMLISIHINFFVIVD